MRDAADAVHMARDNMAAQTVVGAQRFFEVDGTGLGQAAGFAQRFGRDVDGELVASGVQVGGGHARAIEGDAVARADVVEVARWRFDGQSIAMV